MARLAIRLAPIIAAAALVASPLPAAGGGGSTVVQPPRMQLGDAPLDGYPGADQDRITLMWQTTGGDDEFDAAVRRLGADEWTPAGPVLAEALGVGSRVNHWVEITGLDWGVEYEYRIRQRRDGAEVAVWAHSFRTRLRAGDARPFAFGAYGDSAWADSPEPFDSVQRAIGVAGPAFTLLLGDNAYEYGTAEDLDARFDPLVSPSSAEWVAAHVEYPAFGNHDVRTGAGGPTEDAFAVPVPVAGADAPSQPPASERPEHNYSFDHGMVHFVSFDTNSITGPARLTALLDWVVADLAASAATWKIVFGHHPIGGVPDKEVELAAYPHYPREVVTRLGEAGADLFIVGHSHTYSWSYPLNGVSGGEVTFVDDRDGRFRRGAGMVQVVSGVGGHSLRPGRYDAPFIAAGYTLDSDPASEYGFTLVSVTSLQLTVEYVSAEDGRVIGSFAIVIAVPGCGGGNHPK